MGNITVNAIVISSMPLGEYDRRLELLTGSYGRISVFARGARKPSSELVSVSRVFAFGQFDLFQGKTSYTLKGARVSNYFNTLANDIDKTYYGFYFLEIARYFSRENVEASEMLKLLYYSLRALESGRFENMLVRSVYELKMLDINGICPPIDRITNPADRYGIHREILPDTVHALNFILSTRTEDLYTFVLSPEILAELSDITEHLMEMSSDRRFRSLDYI